MLLSDNKKNSVLLLESGEDNDTYEPITNSIFAPVMHSGIGPAKELEDLEIDVVKDNANVGMHMANHSIIAVTFVTNNGRN